MTPLDRLREVAIERTVVAILAQDNPPSWNEADQMAQRIWEKVIEPLVAPPPAVGDTFGVTEPTETPA